MAGISRILAVALMLPALVALAALAPTGAGAAGPHSATSPAGAPAYHVFFGDLHDHTHFSDGHGTPEQAWAQAAAGGADFMAVTDHREGLRAAEWIRTQSAADSATTATFVAIPAFEVKPAIGHLNVYATQELPAVGLDGAALYDWIAAQGAVGQWNHPTRNSDDFAGYAYRTATRTAAIALLEVVNGERVAASRTVNGTSAGWTTTVPSKAGAYYYLRVRTKGVLGLPTRTAWTAPVWVIAAPRPAGQSER